MTINEQQRVIAALGQALIGWQVSANLNRAKSGQDLIQTARGLPFSATDRDALNWQAACRLYYQHCHSGAVAHVRGPAHAEG